MGTVEVAFENGNIGSRRACMKKKTAPSLAVSPFLFTFAPSKKV
jgi:hypothetical protein